ncbi:MAG: metal ABC transporter ATP-binding protein [Candidatus Eremiobacteraeota bacterium]|nr:metal ABC transporter ATP-binding protein [Candidatus Eremiobacteraeota bacterium]
MADFPEGHDHTHVPAALPPTVGIHTQAIAPGAPHLHGHAGHPQARRGGQAAPHDAVAPSDNAVLIDGVCAGYFGRDVLDEVSFAVRRGEFIGIIGPNGSGKSTLLKVIAGLLPVQCGDVAVFGRRPRRAVQRLIGYVPQSESVNWSFPITVLGTVLMGTYPALGFFRRPGQAERQAAQRAIHQVGMSDFADTQISQLSGGQQQRVFLARALVQDPQLLLLDEPIAGVDATTQHAIFTLLEDLQRKGTTIIVTTHDLSCVAEWFDKVLALNHHVIAYAAPEIVLTREILSATFGSHVLVGAER